MASTLSVESGSRLSTRTVPSNMPTCARGGSKAWQQSLASKLCCCPRRCPRRCPQAFPQHRSPDTRFCQPAPIPKPTLLPARGTHRQVAAALPALGHGGHRHAGNVAAHLPLLALHQHALWKRRDRRGKRVGKRRQGMAMSCGGGVGAGWLVGWWVGGWYKTRT